MSRPLWTTYCSSSRVFWLFLFPCTPTYILEFCWDFDWNYIKSVNQLGKIDIIILSLQIHGHAISLLNYSLK